MFDALGRITELKEERGWTSYRVAKNAGIPQSSLATWYSKNISPPLDAIEKMCIAFDIPLSEFFTVDEVHEETNLSRIRKKVGMSQRELAEKSGVPLTGVLAYEHSTKDIKKASYYVIENLARTLGCSVDDIV